MHIPQMGYESYGLDRDRQAKGLSECFSSLRTAWSRWSTFKRLGAHAHRELKSPRDLQKARGGRSDPRAKHPNPATSGRRGKITHRHPHLPAMESLSPRLRRLVNDQCKGKCVKGAQCPMAHVCNYLGCFSSTHARVQQHPVRPPQPR